MYAVLPDENWHMTSNGMVHVPGYKTYQHHEHCNDMYYDTDTGPDGFYPFVCFDPPPGETRCEYDYTKLSVIYPDLTNLMHHTLILPKMVDTIFFFFIKKSLYFAFKI